MIFSIPCIHLKKLFVFTLLLMSCPLTGIFAKEFTTTTAQASTPSLIIEGAYIFTPLKGSSATAGYALLKNPSNKDLVIEKIDSVDFGKLEIHESMTMGDHVHMHPVEKLIIPAGKSLELKPGGHHIMLFDSKKNFQAGDTSVLVFSFAKSQKSQSVEFKIKDRK